MTEMTTILDEIFNIDQEQGTPEFEPLPKGNYVATITDAKVGPLKSGRGQAVQLTWEIEGGEHSKRLIWDRVIVQHDSVEAMRIGRQKLKDVCDACEAKGVLTDLTVLCNRPVSIFVVIEQDADGQYPPKNIVRRVKPIARPDTGNGAAAPAKPEFNDTIPF